MNLGALGLTSRGGMGSLGALGGAGTPVVLPTAPILAMDPLWDTTDNEPDFTIDIDDTVAAGDDVRLQIQAAGGDWSVLVSNTLHDITAPEDAADEIDLALAALPNANYEARANVVTAAGTSNWSNTVSFTVAAVAANLRIPSAGNKRIASAGNYRKAA